MDVIDIIESEEDMMTVGCCNDDGSITFQQCCIDIHLMGQLFDVVGWKSCHVTGTVVGKTSCREVSREKKR